MQNFANKLQLNKLRKAGKLGACAMCLTLALGSAPGWAYTDGPLSYDAWNASPRYGRSGMGRPPRVCAPANGAQIQGGFAGPDDFLDPATGDVCPR